MSSTEAELVALAECAVELLHVIGLVRFFGLKVDGPVEVETDNKEGLLTCAIATPRRKTPGTSTARCSRCGRCAEPAS